MAAASFNRLDRFVLAGIPGVPIELPHVLGSDGAGWVEAVGVGVNDLELGDRVLINPGLWDGTCPACIAGIECQCRQFRILGEHTQGSVTDRVVVPRRNVHPIPPGLSFEQAAAAPLVFQTAWRAIVTIGAVAPGETVAVIGAGGGVATAVIQVAKLRGARVVVASRTAGKLAAATALGADATLTFSEGRPLDRVLWEWSGKQGIDVIFDSVGAPTLPRSVRALARGGRAVVIGATAGPVVELDVRTLFWRQASVRGSTMATRAEFATMFEHLVAGRLRPVVDQVYHREDARAAFARLDAPDLFGKVVVRVSADA
ncbi:MAG: zinc-binding dehydrogenase [Thermoplasmata archaeon]|nr:zinc-binding dehydrogenase [Thermoplasmata archaeon]